MRNKLIALGTLAIALLAVIAFTTKDADAYRGDYTQVGPNHTEEREARMIEIFDSVDEDLVKAYDEWVAFMTEDGRTPGVLDKIDTADKFETFVEAKELAQEGNVEEANQKRAELGLGQGDGQMKRNGNGEGQGTMARDGNCNR